MPCDFVWVGLTKKHKKLKKNVQFFTFDLNIVEELALDFIALYGKGYVPGVCRR